MSSSSAGHGLPRSCKLATRKLCPHLIYLCVSSKSLYYEKSNAVMARTSALSSLRELSLNRPLAPPCPTSVLHFHAPAGSHPHYLLTPPYTSRARVSNASTILSATFGNTAWDAMRWRGFANENTRSIVRSVGPVGVWPGAAAVVGLKDHVETRFLNNGDDFEAVAWALVGSWLGGAGSRCKEQAR